MPRPQSGGITGRPYSRRYSRGAVFEVDRYEDFVHVQADAALRNLATRYSYTSSPASAQKSLQK